MHNIGYKETLYTSFMPSLFSCERCTAIIYSKQKYVSFGLETNLKWSGRITHFKNFYK